MKFRIAALLLALVVGAVACGADEDTPEATATTAAVETTTTEGEVFVPEATTSTTELVVEEEPETPAEPAAPAEQPAPPAGAGSSPVIADPFNPPAGPTEAELGSMTPTPRAHPDALVNVRAVPYSSLESVGGTLRAGVIGNDCTRGHSIHLTPTWVDPGGVQHYAADVFVGELAGCTPTVEGIALAVTGGAAPTGYWSY